MKSSTTIFSWCVSLLLSSALSLKAQSLLPSPSGEAARYDAYIELPRGYLSGVCIMRCAGDTLRGSIFNEFGVSAMDFVYDRRKDRVRLLSVMKMMDRWYIRRTLRSDLRLLLRSMNVGEGEYRNERRHILYRFTPMADSLDTPHPHDTEE